MTFDALASATLGIVAVDVTDNVSVMISGFF